jgi:hypothetical protein
MSELRFGAGQPSRLPAVTAARAGNRRRTFVLDDGREVRLAEIEVPPLPETDAAPGAVALAQLGLWTNPYYDLLDVDEPVGVVARHRRFALAKGKVVSVRVSGATS